jgi:hypothetical protein
MSTFTVTAPTDGGVTLNLDAKDAEILIRALGMVNVGNLRTFSPTLLAFVDDGVAAFGRTLRSEARAYGAEVIRGQVYIVIKDDL